jgi:hypothetical protein
MERLLSIGLLVILTIGGAGAASASCNNHGGEVGCDPSEGRVLCADGQLDRGQLCVSQGHTSQARDGLHAVVLRFKPDTENGQVLRPGEIPPPTTFPNSR